MPSSFIVSSERAGWHEFQHAGGEGRRDMDLSTHSCAQLRERICLYGISGGSSNSGDENEHSQQSPLYHRQQ
jgi:hypothetical protein